MAHFKLMESAHWLAVLDNRPLSDGHALILAKRHGHSMATLQPGALREVGPFVAQLARALGDIGGGPSDEGVSYNLLLNHGQLAHQVRFII